jgi:hypothetical protein
MLDDPQRVLSNEEMLKAAAITLPSIQRLFLRLQAEGLVSADVLPLSLEEAVEQFRAALGHGTRQTKVEMASSISGISGTGTSRNSEPA